MNYTENYHLPQWEETDRIMRTDFNEAMAGIESGLTEAKNTADLAQASYALGLYTGIGVPHRVKTGFRPRFVVIYLIHEPGNSEGAGATDINFFCYPPMSGTVAFEDDGFLVEAKFAYPSINVLYKQYGWIALR